MCVCKKRNENVTSKLHPSFIAKEINREQMSIKNVNNRRGKLWKLDSGYS